MKKFRKMEANEISLRVDTVDKNSVTLVPYADSRVYMDILDEGVGPSRWTRHQRVITVDGVDCMISSVAVFDEKINQWIEKEDVGVAYTDTERPKSMSSDSFKRACVNFGIGRELYRAPAIRLSRDNFNIAESDGMETTFDKCVVSSVEYGEDGNFTVIEITNLTTNRKVRWNKKMETDTTATAPTSSTPKQEQKPVENVVKPILRKPEPKQEEAPVKEEVFPSPEDVAPQEEKPKTKKSVSSKKVTPAPDNSPAPIPQPTESSDGQMEFGLEGEEISAEDAKKILVDVGGQLIKQGKTLGDLNPTQFKWVYEHTNSENIKKGCLAIAKADDSIRKFMISCGIPV